MSGPYKRNAAVRKLFPARTGCWSDTLRRMLPGRVTTEARGVGDRCQIGNDGLVWPGLEKAAVVDPDAAAHSG
jgi:hypothetical protein